MKMHEFVQNVIIYENSIFFLHSLQFCLLVDYFLVCSFHIYEVQIVLFNKTITEGEKGEAPILHK